MLVLDEVFRVGRTGEEDIEQFYRVGGAAVDSERRLFVLDRGNFRVAVFDSLGTFLHQFGRQGEGPGEFRDPAHLLLARDTIVVQERGSYRVHAYTTDGTVVATQMLRSMDPLSDEVVPAGAAPSGWLLPVARAENVMGGGGRPPVLRMELHWFSPSGGGMGEPAGFDWSEEQEGEWVNGTRWVRPLFATHDWWTLDGLGRIHLGDSGEYAWETYDAGGVLLARTSNLVPPVPITDGDIERWKASIGCGAGERWAECGSESQRASLDLPRPGSRPVVGGFAAFVHGHLAVRRADLDPDPFESGDTAVWEFFDPDGRYLGRVERTFTPLWFDGRVLIARERDDLDVETVVWYRVPAPPRL